MTQIKPTAFMLSILLTFSSISFAAKAKNEVEIKKIYKEFDLTRTEFLKTDFNKKNFKEKFNELYAKLNASLQKVQSLEAGQESIVLTSEGNQMAFDIEIFEPLNIMARGSVSKEECNQARYEHELNFPIVKDENSKAIDNIINVVCN